MQLPDSTDIINNLPENSDQKPNQQKDENVNDDNDTNSTAVIASVDGDADNSNLSSSVDEDSVLDVSGKSVELSILGGSKEYVDGLYLYKNVFNLIPKSVGAFSRLRNLKFFGNEINLFPAEVADRKSVV